MGIRGRTSIKLLNRNTNAVAPTTMSKQSEPAGKFDFDFITSLKKKFLDEISPGSNLVSSFESRSFRSDMARFAQLNRKLIEPGDDEDDIAASIDGGTFEFATKQGNRHRLQLSFLNWYDRGFEPRFFLVDGVRHRDCGYSSFTDDNEGNEMTVDLTGFSPTALKLLKEVVRQIQEKHGNIKL